MKMTNRYSLTILAGLVFCLAASPLAAKIEEENVEITQKHQTESTKPSNETPSKQINKEIRITPKSSGYTLGMGGGGGLAGGGGRFGGGFGVGTGNYKLLLSDRAESGRSFVYAVSPMDEKTSQQLREDLSVMSHLLTKNIRDEVGSTEETSLKWDLFSRDQPLKRIYLEGFGALFFLNVKFPLAAPSRDETSQKNKVKSPLTEWEQARQELFGGSADNFSTPKRLHLPALEPAVEAFNQEKVEKLEETIIKSLANAANISALKSDETVVVAVSGPDDSNSSSFNSIVTNTDHESGNTVIVKEVNRSREEADTSTLMISARKSEIQDFAARKMTLEEFKKKVKISMD